MLSNSAASELPVITGPSMGDDQPAAVGEIGYHQQQPAGLAINERRP
ncbi:hypothetical protein [Micromonospora sp. NPDC049662]